ncbi:MAG: type IV pili twitching motility protein PilT, partial [Nitrospira sp.]|nr:type IV pili twitching motility protein PilT [Nitrospira sp.]
MDLHDILNVMVERDASDVYLRVDLPPTYRIQGATQPIGDAPFTNEQLEALAASVMREKQRQEFETALEMNLALFYPDLGRFRVNIFRQRGNVGFVIRQIKLEIVPLDQLGLPPIIKHVAMSKRGLVLFVGATGSGKSTSLAAMIDHRNAASTGH